MGAGSTPKPQYSGGPEGAFNNQASNNTWANINASNLAQAQQFADQGQWDQAAQQYQLGGGQFGQPQMQAFTQKYGNMFPQSQPTGPTQWAGPDAYYPNWNDDPSSGFANDVAVLPAEDSWIPPQQAATTPAQMLPITPTAPRLPSPTPIQSTSPNWASYVQGNPDLLTAYNQGSPQSIGDWGKSHWESFGQNESRAVNPYSGLLA